MDVRVLGPLELGPDAAKAVALGGRNQRALLAMLVVNRRTLVARDRIIEAVWGDSLPADPVNTLQHYVSRLRRILEGIGGVSGTRVLQRMDEGYRLEISPDLVDADRFASSVASALEARRRGKAGEVDRLLSPALAEWRGEPFEDLTYFGFLQSDIRRLNGLRLDAFEELFEARLATGHHHESVTELAELAKLNPLRERFWHQLMLALYRSGRQAEALRAYREARRHLGHELGLEPSAELVNLEERILLADPDLHLAQTPIPLAITARAPSVPTPITAFVGRRKALDQVVELLSQRRLVTIMGTSGIGKTRLAIEIARIAGDDFRDGVRFVSLDSISDPELVGPIIAAEVGMTEDPSKEFVEALAQRLARSNILLVLDGCERVATRCAELVACIQSRGPGLTVLATSQVALGVDGETRFELPPMTIDSHQADAVALFLDRARQVRPEFEPTSDELATLERICLKLDGSPLAIELTAARTDVLSPTQLEAEIHNLLSESTRATLDGSFRHGPLAEAVGRSLQLLDDQERDAFDAVSVFAQGFDLTAAQSVAFPSRSTREVAATLSVLAAKSFLRVEQRQGDSQPRFNVPQALRDSALQQLASSDRRRADRISARHAAWYAMLGQQSDAELRGPDHQRWLRIIDVDEGNLRAAMTWAVDSSSAALLDRSAGHLSRYWDWKGRIAEATGWLRQALALNSGTDSVDRGWVLVWGAYFAAESGDLERAEQLAHEATVIADEQHHSQQRSAARGNLGIIHRQAGRFAEATFQGEQAVEMAAAAGDDWFEAWAATALAATKLQSPETGNAHELGKKSLEIFRRLGDQGGEAWSLDILARVALDNNELDTAASLARDALFHAHLLGAHRTLIGTLEILARIAREDGSPARSVEFLSAANALQDKVATTQRTDLTETAAATLVQLKASLTAAEYAAAWDHGQGLDLDTVLGV